MTTYAPDVLTTRGYNWEFSAALQHELMPRVSLNVAYFRRSYGNIRVTQNTAVTTADYTTYCVSAPVDSRLPGGGGNQLCGYFDVNLNKFGQTLNVIQEASHFGTAEDVYDGIDLTEIVRLARSISVSGGVSIGRERVNNCYAQNDLSLMSADRFVDRDNWGNIVAIKHLVDCEPEDIAIHRGDAPEFVILTVAPNALVDLREMRHHSFDERLRKLAHARLGRTKLPEIVDLLRSFATLEVAPEMILDCRFAGAATFTHCPPAV